MGELIPEIARVLSDEDPAVCKGACGALEAIAALRLTQMPKRSHLPFGKPGMEDHGPIPLPVPLPLPEASPLLPELNKTLPALAARVKHKDVQVRLAALYVLEELEGEAVPVVAVVVASLQDEDPFVRWAGGRIAGKMAPRRSAELVPALARRVNDPNGDVRITALAALERFGPEAVPALEEVIGLLGRSDVETRKWALGVLANMGPKVRSHVVVPLLKELTSKEVTLRRKALQALSRLGPPEKDTIPGLQKALKDPDREVRLAASRVLLKKK